MAAKYSASVVGPDGRSRQCLAVVLERDGKPDRIARFGGSPLQRQRAAVVEDQASEARAYYTELEKRVRADTCEVCGSSEQVEVHHIRKLRDSPRKDGRTIPAWRRQMIARQRKTLVLCRACHVKLHSGLFDDNLGVRR